MKKMTQKRPPEQPAADALRTAIEMLNADAQKRTELTESDLKKLDEACRLADDFRAKADEAWASDPWKSAAVWGAPDTIRSIPSMVSRYKNTCTGLVSLSITNSDSEGPSAGDVRAPAIESSAVRGFLYQTGKQIISRIDDAIAAARTRDEASAKRGSDFAASVEYWLACPIVGRLLRAVVLGVDGDMPGIEDIRRALSTVQDHLFRTAQREGREIPEPLYTFGHPTLWIDAVRPFVAGENLPEAA